MFQLRPRFGMVRDKLKRAAQKVGRRFFGMESQAAPRENRYARGGAPRDDVDDDLIPRVVDGSGDTPGPNHKADIGRTWVSAQLLGGEGIVALDVRSPDEFETGHLPGAMLIPPGAFPEAASRLPGNGTEIVIAVYDATGEQEAGEVAAQLRKAGWPRARRLRGGFAEWVEEGEEVAASEREGNGPHRGDTVRLDGRECVVWHVHDAPPSIDVLFRDDGSVRTSVPLGEVAQ